MRAIFLAAVVTGCGIEQGNREPGYDPVPAETAVETDRPGGMQTPAAKTGVARKIIHTANISLAVEDFEPIPQKVAALAAQCDGYVARSNVSGSPGQPRRGSWTIRVPVGRFQELVSTVQQLGEPRSMASDSKDVSEEYYDVESRIRNKKNTEARLLTLLEESTGNLEQILTVEEKLDRVREEIERMEGRIRVLDDLTSMTTVELTIEEIKNFLPKESAAYSTRLQRAFSTSLHNLGRTAQDFSVAMAYLLPWLATLLVVALLLLAARFLTLRVMARHRKRVVQASVVNSPPNE